MATVLKVASALVLTGNATGAAQQCPQGDQVAIAVTTAAVSGTTPSMTVSVAWTQDGTNYSVADPADVFTAITAATSVVKTFARKGIGFQLVYVITGTTLSFTVTATAVAVGSGFTF